GLCPPSGTRPGERQGPFPLVSYTQLSSSRQSSRWSHSLASHCSLRHRRPSEQSLSDSQVGPQSPAVQAQAATPVSDRHSKPVAQVAKLQDSVSSRQARPSPKSTQAVLSSGH